MLSKTILFIFTFLPAVASALSYSGGEGRGVISGSPSGGGVSGGILFEDSSGDVAQDTDLTFSAGDTEFKVGAGLTDYFLITPNNVSFVDGGQNSIVLLPGTIDLYDSSNRNTLVAVASASGGGTLQLSDTSPATKILIRGVGDSYFNSDSQVGIGTTAPTEKLQIQGTGGTYAFSVSTAASSVVALGVANAGGVVSETSLTVTGPSTNTVVQTLKATATNDDPQALTVFTRATTTDATPTAMWTFDMTADTSYLFHAKVIGRRTGGASGAAGDSAVYLVFGGIVDITGTATAIGAGTTTAITLEDQAGWDCAFGVSGGNVLLNITGAVNNNVTWHAEITYQPVAN